MILTHIKKKNFKKSSNFQNNWGLKSVVKNAFQELKISEATFFQQKNLSN